MTITKPDFNAMTEDQFYQAFAQDFAQQAEHSTPIVLSLTWLDAWSIMSSLQLSFRHPSNKGFVRQHAGDVCALLEQLLAKTPVLEEVIRRGRDSQYDSSQDETP